MATPEWRTGNAFMGEEEFMVRATESVKGRAYHMKKAMVRILVPMKPLPCALASAGRSARVSGGSLSRPPATSGTSYFIVIICICQCIERFCQ